MTADRALQAAQAGNDPLTLADARRAIATAMRRTGHPDRACSLLVRACHDIDVGRHATDELAMYGTLLNVAAYAAATPGNAARRQNTSKKPLQPPPDWVPAPPGASPHSGQRGSPYTRSASRKSSATKGPPSST
jgi:hypothetical protein